MSDERKLFDTNILVHAYNISDEKKHRIAHSLVKKAWQEGGGITALQNLMEFFAVITKRVKRPISKSDAEILVNDILNSENWEVIDRDEDIFVKAMGIAKEANISLWDALIAATMIENGVLKIVTDNEKDFHKIKGIEVVNPFR